jgi:serine phosphatase RsbU (regulator of sigma subunit)
MEQNYFIPIKVVIQKDGEKKENFSLFKIFSTIWHCAQKVGGSNHKIAWNLAYQVHAYLGTILKGNPATVEQIEKSIEIILSNNKYYSTLDAYKHFKAKHTEAKLLTKILEKDLEMAQKIQQYLLPQNNLQLKGISYCAGYYPLDQVGGDYYYMSSPEENMCGIYMSDACGHGIAAALMMSMQKPLIEKCDKHLQQYPSAFLGYLNENFIQWLAEDNFITAFYGIINLKTKMLTYANAGHCLPILWRNNEIITIEKEDAPQNKPLGIMKKNNMFQHQQFQLATKDKLIFYTDGLTDTTNSKDEAFEQYLPEIIKANGATPADKLQDILYQSLVMHRNSKQFDDDVCILVIEIV